MFFLFGKIATVALLVWRAIIAFRSFRKLQAHLLEPVAVSRIFFRVFVTKLEYNITNFFFNNNNI